VHTTGAQPESLFHPTEDRMGTDTSSALEKPSMTAATPKLDIPQNRGGMHYEE